MQENKQEKSPIKQKILLYLEKKGISQYEFYKNTGITRGILSQNNGISEENIARFLACYTDINLEWLLMDQGLMLKNEEVIQIHQPKILERIYDEQEILLYDITAAANLQTLFTQKDQNILGAIKIPDAPKCDGALYVSGDSMYPLLKSGDIIAYKAVYNFQYLLYGEMYLIDFEIDGEEYVTIKYINKSDDPGMIKLVSYNTHHQPVDIPMSTVRSLAIVKFSIRKNMMR